MCVCFEATSSKPVMSRQNGMTAMDISWARSYSIVLERLSLCLQITVYTIGLPTTQQITVILSRRLKYKQTE